MLFEVPVIAFHLISTFDSYLTWHKYIEESPRIDFAQLAAYKGYLLLNDWSFFSVLFWRCYLRAMVFLS